jgi:hypothetical protein
MVNGARTASGCAGCNGTPFRYAGPGGWGSPGSGKVGCPACGGTGQVESKEEKEAKESRAKGWTALEQKRYEDAEEFYKQVPKPLRTKWDWYNLGVAIHNQHQGREKEVLDCYNEALRLDPNYEKAAENKASVEEGMQRHEVWEEAMAAHNAGHWAEAAARWKQVIGMDPSADAYNNLGIALKMQRRYTEARRAYQEAISLDPNSSAKKNLDSLNRTLDRMQQSHQEIAGVIGETHVPNGLADQGAYGQLLDVYFHSDRAHLLLPDATKREAPLGFDTEGRVVRGRLLPDFTPPSVVASNQQYQGLMHDQRSVDDQIEQQKKVLFNPRATPEQCQAAVKKMTELQSESVWMRFQASVMADPKPLTPLPAKTIVRVKELDLLPIP